MHLCRLARCEAIAPGAARDDNVCVPSQSPSEPAGRRAQRTAVPPTCADELAASRSGHFDTGVVKVFACDGKH